MDEKETDEAGESHAIVAVGWDVLLVEREGDKRPGACNTLSGVANTGAWGSMHRLFEAGGELT